MGAVEGVVPLKFQLAVSLAVSMIHHSVEFMCELDCHHGHVVYSRLLASMTETLN